MGQGAVPYVMKQGGNSAHGPDSRDRFGIKAGCLDHRVKKRQEHVHYPYAVRKAGVGGVGVHDMRQSQLL